jgi:FkbM family methyltransferase
MNLLFRVYSLVPRSMKNSLKDSKLNSIRILIAEIRLRVWPRKFYSQTGEDVVLRSYLPEKVGFYLDIGAGRPFSGSNTYLLYRRGWKGVCVDPLKSNTKLFKALRPRDKVLDVLISSKRQSVPFWEFEPYEYSTADSDVAQELMLREGVRLLQYSSRECWPLSDIAPVATPLNPSFLSIDVEGLDLTVLSSNDWSRYSPRVVCVEEWGSDLRDTELSDIHLFMIDKGYKRKAWTGLSSIYVHRDYLEFLSNS